MALPTTGAMLVGTGTALTLILASIWVRQSVSRYGFGGTIRLIWEGDALTPEARTATDKLDDLESSMQIQEESLLELELTLARARLDSVDEAMVVPQWNVSYAPKNLKKDLAKISYDLDSLAATVDSVPSSVDVDIKHRKKLYSEQLVLMMRRVDILLACYLQTKAGQGR